MNNREKRNKIKSLQNQIRRYENYIVEENPLMYRSIESYKRYIPILKNRLKALDNE